jgi:hypothetical protein
VHGVGLLIPASNTVMERDPHRELGAEALVHTARMAHTDVTAATEAAATMPPAETACGTALEAAGSRRHAGVAPDRPGEARLESRRSVAGGQLGRGHRAFDADVDRDQDRDDAVAERLEPARRFRPG